jgi:hypothetical protein
MHTSSPEGVGLLTQIVHVSLQLLKIFEILF